MAFGISGNQQVGWGQSGRSNNHALLWSGSASSYVDLNPSGFTESEAFGISGNQQVGFAVPGTNNYYGYDHAVLWSGSASSYVDLNPSGFTQSEALGLSGNQQVGFAEPGTNNPIGNITHAVLWSGSANSCVDLQSFLPAYYYLSEARGIDANGDIVGYALNTLTIQDDAILWTPVAVPEPTSLTLLTTALLGLVGYLFVRRRSAA
jgi:hypothetical protein